MNNTKLVEAIRSFFNRQYLKDNLIEYQVKENPNLYFKNLKIGVEINKFKDVILKEETELELGGFGRKSFSLAFPVADNLLVNNGGITLLGAELNTPSSKHLDFGMFLLLKFKNLNENLYRKVNRYNFISNGIEGFSIRTIPRRFWCRINKEVIKKGFNLEFFGNALHYLYKSKFKDLQVMEIFFINSESSLIVEFLDLTSQIRLGLEKKWKKRVEDWKKRVDCEYDWGCEICPDYNECESIKELLATRKKISN